MKTVLSGMLLLVTVSTHSAWAVLHPMMKLDFGVFEISSSSSDISADRKSARIRSAFEFFQNHFAELRTSAALGKVSDHWQAMGSLLGVRDHGGFIAEARELFPSWGDQPSQKAFLQLSAVASNYQFRSRRR